jgi:energy-coupling factor transporter transmembrane protein EcfT
MVKTKRRALSLIVLVFLPEIILLVLGFYYISLLAAYSRMSITFVLWVVFLPVWSIGMILLTLWFHFAMKLPLPPFKQSFLHPKVMKEGIGKGMILFLALLVFESLDNAAMSIAFLVSIAIILGSWYSLIVEFELSHNFAKYTSLYNPLKRKDEL